MTPPHSLDSLAAHKLFSFREATAAQGSLLGVVRFTARYTHDDEEGEPPPAADEHHHHHILISHFTLLVAHGSPSCSLPCDQLLSEAQINQRLWDRLPNSSNAATYHREQACPPLSSGEHRHEHRRPGKPATATIAAAVTTPNNTSPFPAQQPPSSRRQSPVLLLSLFSEDSSDDEQDGGGRNHNREHLENAGNRGGWGGGNPPSSRGQSLRPWKWPDIRRGASTLRVSPKEAGQQIDTAYSTPCGEQGKYMHLDSDERGRLPSLEGQRGGEPGEIGGEAAGAEVGLERGSIYGGLGLVKKRLWGSMFEGLQDVDEAGSSWTSA